ncbi:hypothetical protein TWF281_004810 [Arthrobotrys megalospora]
MFGRNTEKKRFSSLHRAIGSSSKAIGKVLWGKQADTDIPDTAPEPAPRPIEPPLLPTEILRLIFELFWDTHPPTEDVQCFRQACKLFNQIALEYLYADLTIPLNEGDYDTTAIDRLIEHNKEGLTHVSRLRVTGFPPGLRRTGRISVGRPIKYGPDSRKSSQGAVKGLLEALSPGQLTSFVIAGRHIPMRVDKIFVPLLLGRQSNLRQLCIPITLLFQHGINTHEALEGVTIPSFESLVLTDLQYPRHIADVWTLLQNSSDTLKSLAIKTPEDSDLEKFLLHRSHQRATAGLAPTELPLRKLRDLHLEGIPYLDKVIEDCAPNLIDFSNLRMLRLQRCPKADILLLTRCSVYRMPKLKSLQLVDTGSSIALDGIMPSLGAMGLETLVVALHRWEGRPDWGLIKDHLSGSLKRLWIQHMSSYNGPGDLFDTTNRRSLYNNTFFPHGWPKLEEVAIDTNYLDGSSITLPETVKVCRIIGPRAQDVLRRSQPSASHVERIINFRCAEGKQLNVKVSAIGTLDHPDIGRAIRHPFFYKVAYTTDKVGNRVSSPKFVLMNEAMREVPDSHILWFERTDRPWSDRAPGPYVHAANMASQTRAHSRSIDLPDQRRNVLVSMCLFVPNPLNT